MKLVYTFDTGREVWVDDIPGESSTILERGDNVTWWAMGLGVPLCIKGVTDPERWERLEAERKEALAAKLQHDYTWTHGAEPECRRCGFYGPDADDGSLECPGGEFELKFLEDTKRIMSMTKEEVIAELVEEGVDVEASLKHFRENVLPKYEKACEQALARAEKP